MALSNQLRQLNIIVTFYLFVYIVKFKIPGIGNPNPLIILPSIPEDNVLANSFVVQALSHVPLNALAEICKLRVTSLTPDFQLPPACHIVVYDAQIWNTHQVFISELQDYCVRHLFLKCLDQLALIPRFVVVLQHTHPFVMKLHRAITVTMHTARLNANVRASHVMNTTM